MPKNIVASKKIFNNSGNNTFSPKPVLYNLMFGHVTENAILPIGVVATLDATAKTLTINEGAVI
jgi:muramoyltetrapeptide carboxypeptidase LdcA involved in peptidoglycan recycling